MQKHCRMEENHSFVCCSSIKDKKKKIIIDWFNLWCLTPLSTILQLYRGAQFYWRRKSEYLEKTTELSQTLSHNVVLSTPPHEQGSNSQLLVGIGKDCIDSCKSNYHTIMATTTPNKDYHWNNSVNMLESKEKRLG